MRIDNFKEALELLKRAEHALKSGLADDKKSSLLGVTYNNFG